MKSIGFTHFGGPEVFEEITTKELPTYKENQVLIKTLKAGVNPYDALLRSGEMAKFRPLAFPIIPGTDVVGEIIAVGNDVTDFSIGDIVIANPSIGGYSQYIAISHKRIMKKPEKMSLSIAAGFASVSVTAYWAIMGFAPVKKGATIIIQGASGAVGGVAVQIAKDNGLYVIGIGNSRNKEYVLSLGADEFVAYNEEHSTSTLANRADIVLDASFGGKGAPSGLDLVKDGGYYLSLTAVPEAQPDKNVTIVSIQRTKDMTTGKALTYLSDLYQRKEIIMETALEFPLTAIGASKAHQAIETKKQAGKIILSVENN